MLQLLAIAPGDKAVDIGSGDGRVVISMAKMGAEVVGVEKNSHLTKVSTQNISKEKLTEKAKIVYQDMFLHDYRPYNKVVIYQFKTVMSRLEQKLHDELPAGARIVSNYWQFPNWKAYKKVDDIFLYVKK